MTAKLDHQVKGVNKRTPHRYARCKVQVSCNLQAAQGHTKEPHANGGCFLHANFGLGKLRNGFLDSISHS